jgi:ketosteroid isomerase-like protein
MSETPLALLRKGELPLEVVVEGRRPWMGTEENRKTVEQALTAVNKQDFEGWKQLLHKDYVQEWPQSGERIRGPDNATSINENYPGVPTLTIRRVTGTGDVIVGEAVLEYPEGGTYHGVSVFEFKDGKIWKETDFFGQPFEAPEWRSKWVEKM